MVLLNWTALIVFLVLAVIGLWVSYSFLKEKGLYLFTIITVVLLNFFDGVSFFGYPISIGTVIMPVLYFTLLACFKKFGKEEAKKLFLTALIALTATFVCIFFQAAYLDAFYGVTGFLSWAYLGSFITSIICFALASYITLIFVEKVKIKKLNKTYEVAFYIALACLIDNLIFVSLAYVGALSFGSILLVILIKFILQTACAIGLAYFERYLNREVKLTAVSEKNENQEIVVEQVKEEIKEEVKEEVKETNKKSKK